MEQETIEGEIDPTFLAIHLAKDANVSIQNPEKSNKLPEDITSLYLELILAQPRVSSYDFGNGRSVVVKSKGQMDSVIWDAYDGLYVGGVYPGPPTNMDLAKSSAVKSLVGSLMTSVDKNRTAAAKLNAKEDWYGDRK